MQDCPSLPDRPSNHGKGMEKMKREKRKEGTCGPDLDWTLTMVKMGGLPGGGGSYKMIVTICGFTTTTTMMDGLTSHLLYPQIVTSSLIED